MKIFNCAGMACIMLCVSSVTEGQKQNSASHIFSAIMGSTSKPDTIQLAPNTKSVAIINGDTSQFKILSHTKQRLVIAFAPAHDFTGIARATLMMKESSGKKLSPVQLTGLSTKGFEGANEAPLSLIADALGYRINIGWNSLDNNTLPQLMGEEIAVAQFKKAGPGKVEMFPVARYSPDFALPFGYYVNSSSAPQKKQVGILAVKDNYPQHQTLFPAIASGGSSFDPGQNSFGFYADGPTHTAYSEDVWNMSLYPANAVHAMRIYRARDASGKSVAHTYLLCVEEAKNGDYNDYVFLVKNIAPVTSSPFVSLFNGKNLQGWHTFLRDIGTSKDPDNNFMIEDESLHVLGKDLGYAITEKGYANFHFKVDFKWGERRWDSRKNEKRDAGICYNISMNEPDSIWPQSIECQIQEGDVGDFWLLGFSTIKVGGQQNVPANHTRMTKQKDAEKPYGEWNTVEIISYNGRCVHIVNGVVVNVGEKASIKNGRILLQSEYAEIYYRNVKIRQL
jgi:hypothetical protein